VTIDPAQERYLLELGGFVFPPQRGPSEAMFDGVAERGGGCLTRQSDLAQSLRKRAGAVPFNGTLIGPQPLILIRGFVGGILSVRSIIIAGVNDVQGCSVRSA
jgi:hypothetical protein